MTDFFHNLEGFDALGDVEPLSIPRARALWDAVLRHRDYKVVKLLRHADDAKGEGLIVDVECHGVPPHNTVGIKFRERLAIVVWDRAQLLVEVWALRKNFPVLIHQNHGRPGSPASLCLYFESPLAVARTWTPENFLQRIQWWLEKSSRGELHPADQPVESLFFASKYELILPWNFRAGYPAPEGPLSLVRGPDHPGGGFTCFLLADRETRSEGVRMAYIELRLPPIVHGFVERDPCSLGQLADMLDTRGVKLLPPLVKALQERVGVAGTEAEGSTDKGTVVLLNIPIIRSEAEQTDGFITRAFLIPADNIELGLATGALMRSPDSRRYFKDLFNPPPSAAWREQAVWPMDVLWQNDRAAARRQSGILDEGPAGTLVGAGTLGSAILNLWGRSGWGSWTVVDSDYIKPHNLSRHSALLGQVGIPKSIVVAQLHSAFAGDASAIMPVVADANDFENKLLMEALKNGQVVIDASTTLEYPRAASKVDDLPRHVSIFITPNGNSAVMLVEDSARTIRLRTLEAQYYRSLVMEDWGAEHLDGNNGTFWSGASCRDISLVLPYSRIMGHASTLAEQIPMVLSRESAMVRVWQRIPERGSVVVREVAVSAERHLPFDKYDLFFDTRLEEELKKLRAASLPNETGGVLLGYYDFNVNSIVLVAALPAPPDSESERISFKRGVFGLADLVEEVGRRTAGIVRYVGEWHSHPPNCSTSPSSNDLSQLAYLARGMADEGLPAVQLIVGELDVRVLKGELIHG